ncbi:MAG: cytochrome P450 [Pseudomonadota bacterium]|nr:cytochrome P450 [Pseudomonadota bacterium]
MAQKNALHPIPNPAGQPIVGNAFSVDASTPLQSLMEIAREQGPIFWLDMMGRPVIFVSGAELVKELCDEKRFDKAVRGALRRVRVIAGDGLFTGDTQEPNWSKAHNILLPTFAQRAMNDYMPMMVDVATQLCLKWERLNADDEIDVVRDMTGLALDTIGLCGFDYRFNSFYRSDFHPFIDALTRTLETCMMRRGLPFEDVVLKKRLDQLKDDAAFMNKLVDDIVRERRRGGGDKSQKDLLNYMLAGVDKVTGESLSDENIRYQINTFLIAGHETTSGLLSFTLYFLLNHPDVLARAYEEVDRVLGRDVATAPTISQVNQLDYIRAILLESLRLWPTAPAFSVYPYKDEMIGGDYKLKKGAFVNVLTLMLHRDKSVWGEDAERFNPENFSREAEATRPTYAYKPFGNGQRACIGRQFAMQEATLVIGMILQRFQLFDHRHYKLKIKESLSIKPDGFRIKARLRPDVTRSRLVAAAAPVKAEASPAIAQRPKHGAPLYVLYGSNLGATEAIAREIAQSGEINGFKTVLAPLDDYAGNLPTDGAVIIASASYNGAPPDNAAKFLAWLGAAREDAAAGVSYAVFGCGNRDWASTFQAVPRRIDERLEALGARRIAARGEGDAREDIDGQFQSWFEALWPQLGEAMGLKIDFTAPVEAEPLYKVEFVERIAANPVANQTGARPMRVLANRELQNVVLSGRSTRHIEIELPEGAIYRPGDHLCVVPTNCPETVARAMARFGFSDEDHVKIAATGGRRSPFPANSAVSIRRIAEAYGELQTVASRKDVATIARHTRCPVTRAKLDALAAPARGASDLSRSEVFLKRKSALDLLEEFPAAELPFNVFLEMIPWMAPRYYSISSSPKADPRRCSITVGVVEGPARSGHGQYKGVCSTHLASLREGDAIQAVIKKTKAGFRLPDDPARPIVMIGPGTGLAPFRAFLLERAAMRAEGTRLGPALLFFGCRHPDQDYLYREELEAAASEGLAEVYAAFSRAGSDRVYVQDLIRRERDAVWRLIEDGAVIYVCGDGARMEPDVKRALTTLYAEEKDEDAAAADAWMEGLIKENRYVLDVWAGG